MKPIFVVLFIFILCAVIFSSHFFIYRFWIKFCSPASPHLRKIVAALLGFLPLVFIITSFAASRYDHFLLRSSYLVSAFWLGLAANLFFVFLLGWFFYILSKIFSFSLPMPMAAYFLIVFGFVITLVGALNAFRPTVKNIDLHLLNLPPAWQGKTIVQISDLHLGYIHGPSFARALVSLVNQQNPDLILITGDLYDGTKGQLEKSTSELKKLHASAGIYFINGNHEKFLGLATVQKLLEPTPIKTLSNELISLEGLDLVGLEYLGEGSRGQLLTTLQSVPGFSALRPTILLYHEPIDIDQIKNSGVGLMLSGHTHRGQFFPFNFITKLVYRGFDYGLYRWDDFTLYTSSGVGSWGPPVRTSARPEIVVFKLSGL